LFTLTPNLESVDISLAG